MLNESNESRVIAQRSWYIYLCLYRNTYCLHEVAINIDISRKVPRGRYRCNVLRHLEAFISNSKVSHMIARSCKPFHKGNDTLRHRPKRKTLKSTSSRVSYILDGSKPLETDQCESKKGDSIYYL